MPYVKSRGFNQATLCTYTPVYTTYHTYTQVSIIYIHKYNERHEYNEREKEKERESARAPHTHTQTHTHTNTHKAYQGDRRRHAKTSLILFYRYEDTSLLFQAGRQVSKQASLPSEGTQRPFARKPREKRRSKKALPVYQTGSKSEHRGLYTEPGGRGECATPSSYMGRAAGE